ncbi:hypothetical protein F8O01_00475 [Pseudoclavibacter chungangensis]|uniref:Uncharacterized protein n=1 Tax=Pseudoclavibacter chungangensis TaxID=587635 RepID=A0A7J5C3V4_9MICO|nr:hypothetical protein F8O01_00475 [Pseudoclavibacter chungangensis]
MEHEPGSRGRIGADRPRAPTPDEEPADAPARPAAPRRAGRPGPPSPTRPGIRSVTTRRPP